jgi:hypothetical protein
MNIPFSTGISAAGLMIFHHLNRAWHREPAVQTAPEGSATKPADAGYALWQALMKKMKDH